MSEPMFRQRQNRNIRNLNVPITIEMHKSMWIDELSEYETRDLLFNGKLFHNPDLLKTADEKLKKKIRMGYYNTYPTDPRGYEQRLHPISDYIYVGDLNGRMHIFHKEPNNPSNVTKTDYTGDRWIK